MISRLLRNPQTTLLNTRRKTERSVSGRLMTHLCLVAMSVFVPVVLADDGARSLGQRYQKQLDEYFDEVHDRASFEPAGQFWSRETARKKSPPPRSSESKPLMRTVSAAWKKHTYEQPPEPAQDVFETRPLAMYSEPIQKVSATVQEQVAETSTSSSRLKTDIRTIKPSLSYALREIEADQLPQDFESRLDKGEYIARQPGPTVLQWAPTNFYHYPLYFEDPALERYGHTYHPLIQPFASTGRFAGQLVGLPYQMVLHPVHSRQYALGYYRPGEVAPKKHYQIPFNTEATIMETAVVIGLFLILP
jgi:hypothetical protein